MIRLYRKEGGIRLPSATSLAVGKSRDKPTGALFPSAISGLHAALATDALSPSPAPIVVAAVGVVVSTFALIGAGWCNVPLIPDGDGVSVIVAGFAHGEDVADVVAAAPVGRGDVVVVVVGTVVSLVESSRDDVEFMGMGDEPILSAQTS